MPQQRPSPLLPIPNYRSPSLRLSTSDADGLTPRSARLRGAGFKQYDDGEQDAELDEIDFLPTPGKPLLRSAARATPSSDPSPSLRTRFTKRKGSAQDTETEGLLSFFLSRKTGRWLQSGRAHLTLILLVTFGMLIVVLTAISVFSPNMPDDAFNSNIAPPLSSSSSPLSSSEQNADAQKQSQPDPKPTRIVDYSKYASFPLTPLQYAEECWIEQRLAAGHAHGAYWDVPHSGLADVAKHTTDPKVCSSSITYLLDGTTSGLVAELAVMAQIAGLARERRRSFFVIDKFWNRGKWSDYFEDVTTLQRGPELGCLPPPPEELVACPRLAKHWVVSFRTAKFHLTHAFAEEFEDPHGQSVQRQRPIYTRSLESFSTTIRPIANIRRLIALARLELLPLPVLVVGHDVAGIIEGPAPQYISVHIRRGDMRPLSWRYLQRPSNVPSTSHPEIPIADYVSGVAAAIEEFALTALPGNPLTVFVASDSALAIDEFKEKVKEWTASTRANNPRKAIDVEVVSLATSDDGELRALAFPELDGYEQGDWSPDSSIGNGHDGGREIYTAGDDKITTTGMIVDLALLSGLWGGSEYEEEGTITPSAAVCAIKSTICTTMALGLGFDRAFGAERGQRWVDIDARGEIEPVWEAFRLSW